MTRLFFSLYAFIAITLIVLSTVLNHFFLKEESLTPHHQHLIKAITQLHLHGGLSEANISQIGLSSRTISINNMLWDNSDLALLANKQGVILYTPDGLTQLYFQNTDEWLIEIDLPKLDTPQYPLYWYSFLFFVLLAVGTAIWVRPLWRDLELLKQAVKYNNLNEDFTTLSLSTHSIVYPIANALNELKAKVRELICTQMELTGAVAHEFRTPLSRLKFSLNAANISEPKFIAAISQDVQELEKLMDEMLSYASLENHEPELNISEIPLLALCEQRLAVCVPKYTTQLRVSVFGENHKILADDHYIKRAIDNLLQNAIRHANTTVEIHISMDKTHILLSVEDDGKGVSDIYKNKIFEPFFRPDNGRDRSRGGAGLGLSIVKRITIWHGAKCWAENSGLGGAKFCIAFVR